MADTAGFPRSPSSWSRVRPSGWVAPWRRVLWLVSAGSVALAVLTGCGGSDESVDPTALVATATVPPGVVGGPSAADAPVATRVEVGALVWATAIESGTNRPTAEVSRFDVTASVIYAVVPVTAAPLGATLNAEWTFNTTPIQGVAASVQLPELRAASIWVEFHLERQSEEDWPDGPYTVTVREGDRVVGAGTVDVDEE